MLPVDHAYPKTAYTLESEVHQFTGDLVLRLTGIPRADPSSDLFGPATKATESFDTGGEKLALPVVFQPDGALLIEDNPFTANGIGQWKLDKNGKTVSILFESIGFERTFITKGSLQSVFGGTDTSRTSSGYYIPVSLTTLLSF